MGQLLEVAERLVRPVTGQVSADVRGALHMFAVRSWWRRMAGREGLSAVARRA